MGLLGSMAHQRAAADDSALSGRKTVLALSCVHRLRTGNVGQLVAGSKIKEADCPHVSKAHPALHKQHQKSTDPEELHLHNDYSFDNCIAIH